MKIIKGVSFTEIQAALKETGGYCPCVPKYAWTEDTKCMCKEFREQEEGECHCKMFIKVKEDLPMYDFESYILWAKTNENAIIPTKRDEDAGYDLYGLIDYDYAIIMPNTNLPVKTGIASAFSEGRVGIIEERGSTGIINLGKGAGVIDSGYRGEWVVILRNEGDKPIVYTKFSAEETIELMKKDFETEALFTPDFIFYPCKKAIAQVYFPLIPNFNTELEVTYDEIVGLKSLRGAGKLGASEK